MMASVLRFFGFAALVCGLAAPAAAQTLSVEDRPDGATLRFAAGASDSLGARVDGATVSISFSQRLSPPDLEATAAAALIANAQMSEDGLTLILVAPASIDARRAGGTIALDLYRDLGAGVGQIVIGPVAAASAPQTAAQPRVQPAVATAPAAAAMQIPAAIGQGEPVRVRVGEHPDRTRLVFDWPSPVTFERRGAGGATAIRFARSARLDLSALQKHQPRRIASLEFGEADGGTTVALSTRPGGEVKVFALDRRIVIDAIGPRVSGAPMMAVAAAPAQASPPASMTSAPAQPQPTPAAAPPVRPQMSAAEAQPAADAAPQTVAASRPRTRTGPAFGGFYAAARLGGGAGGLSEFETPAGEVVEEPSSGLLVTSGELGYDFHRLGAPIRIGMELNNHAFGDYSLDNAAGFGGQRFEVNSFSLLGVASLDFKGPLAILGDGPLAPFLTGGVGLAINAVDVTDAQGVASLSETERNLAWMVGGGLSYDYGERLALEGRYAYFDRGSLIDDDMSGLKADLTGHEFTIGARWRF